MFCQNCGSQVPDGVAFCTSCGAPVSQNESQAIPANQQPLDNSDQQPPVNNNQQPPVNNYQQPPVNNYQQPPVNNYQQPPVNNYQQPPVNNYQQPPVNNYQQPPVYNYQQTNYHQQGYQQPGGYYQANGNPNYKAPIYSKNLGTCILLTIITCGIYGIVWFINMVNDLNTASQTPNDSNGTTVFLLSIVTCGIYQWYWLYKAGEKVNAINRMKGLPYDSSASILYLALSFFGLGIVTYCLIQSKLNEVAAYAE